MSRDHKVATTHERGAAIGRAVARPVTGEASSRDQFPLPQALLHAPTHCLTPFLFRGTRFVPRIHFNGTRLCVDFIGENDVCAGCARLCVAGRGITAEPGERRPAARIVNFPRGNHSLPNSLEQRHKPYPYLSISLSIYKVLTNRINNLQHFSFFSFGNRHPNSVPYINPTRHKPRNIRHKA